MTAGKRERASPTVRREPAWRLNALSKKRPLQRLAPGEPGKITDRAHGVAHEQALERR